MKSLIPLYLVLAAFVASPATSAKINEKFFAKASEKVWSSGGDVFDPATEIPESVAGDASAVIIAQYSFIDANRNLVAGAMGNTDYSRRTMFTRKMVKILDESALEKFSEFKFGAKKKYKGLFSYPLGSTDHAFGARVCKPSGEIKVVDIGEALPESSGKKGDKETSYRIAIPDLEPGDVIDYFFYTEESVNHNSLDPFSLFINQEYPIMSYVIEGTFSPELTVYYRGYNGAEKMDHGVDEKSKRNTLRFETHNVPVVTDEAGIRPARQLPMYKFYTLNNQTNYVYVPTTARRGGMYYAPHTAAVYRDIASTLYNSSYEGSTVYPRMKRYVKDFLARNPDLDNQRKVEGCWTAAIYAMLTNPKKITISDYFFSLMFADMMRELKVAEPDAAGVAFITSRDDVPTREILDWEQPDYGVLVNGNFLLPSSITWTMSGEIPGDYQGEEGSAYMGPREKLNMGSLPIFFTTSTKTTGQNVFDLALDVTTTLPDEDSETTHSASAAHRIALTGTYKDLAAEMTSPDEWISAVEEFLAIPENKRWKGDKSDAETRASEIEDITADFVGRLFGHPVSDMSAVEITARGVVADEPAFKINFSGNYSDLFKRAGNDWFFSIGKLVPDSHRFTDAERERTLEFVRSSPGEIRYNITVAPPAGYAFDAESVGQLARTVSSPFGVFHIGATLNEEGKLEIRGAQRHKYYMVPPENWPKLLTLLDAAAEFNDASVLLRKI